MNAGSIRDGNSLPWTAVRLIDRLSDRFEEELRRGLRPAIGDYLAEVEAALREPLLAELVALEWDYRPAGAPPSLDEYLRALPGERAALERIIAGLQHSRQPRPVDEATLGMLRVRCPHCRSPLESDAQSSFREIVCPVCRSEFSLVGDEAAGSEPRQVAHFKLIRPLGTGRFGRVWLAHDTHLDRQVALKLPRQGRLSADEAEQFIREARLAAQLRHPGIVAVHEVGRDGDAVYIVCDYVPGPTLAQWLKRQPPTPAEAAEMCARIAETLEAAHSSGIVHRDVKPSNIILDLAGSPHVADFGLAHRDVGEVAVTIDGRVFGTPAYMSPEQARGLGHLADRRSDVFSLGVMLYEMLAGALPFQGNVRMQLHQVLHEEPRPPRQLNERIPRDLEMICLKAMAKEPAWRYATAGDLAADLRRYLRGEPIAARPIGWLRRFWLWCRRPARIREAGWTLQVVTVVQAVLALAAVGAYLTGLSPREIGGDRAIAVSLVVALVYLPTLAIGYFTIRGQPLAIWLGAATQLVGLVLALGHLLGSLDFYTTATGTLDDDARLRHWAAYSAMAAVAAFYYVVAIAAWQANRQTGGWQLPADRTS